MVDLEIYGKANSYRVTWINFIWQIGDTHNIFLAVTNSFWKRLNYTRRVVLAFMNEILRVQFQFVILISLTGYIRNSLVKSFCYEA